MKRVIPTVIALSAVIACADASAQIVPSRLDGMSVREWKIEKQDDTINVELLISIVGTRLKKKEALVFSACMENGANRLELRPAVITFGKKGRSRLCPLLRFSDEELKWTYGYEEVDTLMYDGTTACTYRSSVPYEPWMEEATLAFNMGIAGCNFMLLDATYFFKQEKAEEVVLRPAISFINAEKIEKTIEVSGTARISFMINKYDIIPDYKDNRKELDKLLSLINGFTRHRHLDTISMAITGYASPDGPYDFNERLQYDRSRELTLYTVANTDLSLRQVEFMAIAEDWVGLRAWITESDMQHKGELLAIIDTVADLDERERQIKRLAGGVPYRVLTEMAFPSLRRSEFVITYSLKDYVTIEELLNIYEGPEQASLTAYEMLLIAGSYDTGSPEYAGVLSTILKYYPEDEAANGNMAASAMRDGNYEDAAKYLQKAGLSPEAMNLKGIAEMMKGNYKSATTYLQEAYSCGVAEAEHNLRELEKVITPFN